MAVGLVVLFGLSAAISWGISDFSGGVATKKINVFYVLIFSQIIGLSSLLIAIAISGESSDDINLFWPILAGIFGGVGLISLYRGLAVGQMSVVAPLSAVISTGIPVIYSIITEGFPKLLHIIALVIASLAIIFLSLNSKKIGISPSETTNGFSNLIYGVTSGVGFGLFFILINQFKSGSVYWLLIFLRLSSISLFILIVIVIKPQIRAVKESGSIIENWKIITLAGIGDTFGNIFFTFATQNGRLDISAMVSSLFPLTTIFLAWIFYKEKISPYQKFGISAAIGAVLLFSL